MRSGGRRAHTNYRAFWKPCSSRRACVALAEIGDKTQLLALLLATRFRAPWPIVLGILVATLANHALAGAVGAWLVGVIGAGAMRWILGLSFLAMAAWTLIPDPRPTRTPHARATAFSSPR